MNTIPNTSSLCLMESVEPRQLMSGDANITLSGGTIQLQPSLTTQTTLTTAHKISLFRVSDLTLYHK
jgi:hypothetical protein